MSVDTLMIPRSPPYAPGSPDYPPPGSPDYPPPGSPAIKNTKEVKTAAAVKKEAKVREMAAKKEAKARKMAENKQRKSAEGARKKVLTELKKNQKILRLAAEKEEKKQARIAERQARREQQLAERHARIIAQREAARAAHQVRLAEERAAYEARRAAQNDPAIREQNARRVEETRNRQIRMMSRCLSDTTTDLRNASRTQQQLTCATTAFQADECPICLEDLGETNCMVLRCGHKTCGDCILRHFQSVGGRKCPVCRDQYAVRVKGWIAPTLFNI